MAVRPVVSYTANPQLLRMRSEPVRDRWRAVRGLADDLKDTLLHHGDGVGLAAPQIGFHDRVIVVRRGAGPGVQPGLPEAIIDPVLVEMGDERLDFDGCLSIPGLFGKTVRPHRARLRGRNERGRALDWVLEGFDAVVVHHEIDHLDGILFIDRADPEHLWSLVEAERDAS